MVKTKTWLNYFLLYEGYCLEIINVEEGSLEKMLRQKYLNEKMSSLYPSV